MSIVAQISISVISVVSICSTNQITLMAWYLGLLATLLVCQATDEVLLKTWRTGNRTVESQIMKMIMMVLVLVMVMVMDEGDGDDLRPVVRTGGAPLRGAGSMELIRYIYRQMAHFIAVVPVLQIIPMAVQLYTSLCLLIKCTQLGDWLRLGTHYVHGRSAIWWILIRGNNRTGHNLVF